MLSILIMSKWDDAVIIHAMRYMVLYYFIVLSIVT